MSKKFLGKGWGFPLRVNTVGGMAVASYEDDIKEACKIILGTALGERVMRPDFGCAVHDLVFEPQSAELIGKVEFFVTNSLNRWEPRIEVKDVKASSEGETLSVEVDYLITATNRADNLVYPFFLSR